MSVQVTHKFVSPKSEQSDPTLVGPNEWNAAHLVIDTSSQASNTDYIFTPQTPNTPLTAGIINTITLTPVPLGVNGTDKCHYLYISGGTGIAEAILISGGSAVANATSGTISFTPVNNHSGAYTISSATAGIAEAEVSLLPGGGVINIAAGSFTIYGAIPAYQNMTFNGQGPGATILIPATVSSTIFSACVPVKTAYGATYPVTIDSICFQNFSIDSKTISTGQNNVYGMAFINSTTSNEFVSFVGLKFDNIKFNNIFNAIYICRGFRIHINDCLFTLNSQIYIGDSTVNDTYHSGSIFITNCVYDEALYGTTGSTFYRAINTLQVLTLQFTETIYINKCLFSCFPQGQYSVICLAGQSEDTVISNCEFENAYIAVRNIPLTIGSTTYYPDSNRFINCTADQVWYAVLYFPNGTSNVAERQCQQWIISNNEFTGLQSGASCYIYFGSYTSNMLISNNHTYGVPAGLFGLQMFDHCQNILFGPNIWTGDETNVIASSAIYNGTSEFPVYGLETQLFQNFQSNIGGYQADNNLIQQGFQSGGNYVITTTLSDIPNVFTGATRTGTYILTAVVNFRGVAGDENQVFAANFVVNGVVQSQGACELAIGASAIGGSVTNQISVKLISGQVAKMQVVKSGGTGTSYTDANTNLLALFIGN